MNTKALKYLGIPVCALSISAPHLWAADPHTSQALEEVVVTATKAGEVSLQDVPAAISVFGEEELQAAHINTIEDLKRQTPGLNITRNGQAARIYLRGIGTNLDFIGSDPSVTVYQDGVYQSRGYTALDDFLNVERVEVLRGPQGTLYGRNSTGGAINVITKLPDATPRVTTSAEVGNFSAHRVSAVASGGLGSDQVIGSLAVMQSAHDPYVDNVNASGTEGLLDDNSKRANGSVRTLLGDKGALILRADYSDKNTATGAYKTTGLGVKGTPSALTSTIPADPFDINIDYPNPMLEQTSWGNAAEVNWQLTPQWMITSLSAYRDLDFVTSEDTDGSNLNAMVTDIAEQQNQASQELRLKYQAGKLSWVSGVFILREDHDSNATVNINLNGSKRNYVANNKTDANAIFSQGTYQVTPQLNATLGLRYSEEQKHFENVYTPTTGQGFTLDETADWKDWSPKVTLDYTLAEGVMVYADASKGFKSGGFNMTASDAQFDPEKVWAYELGAKLDWLNQTVRTNLAVFYYNYTDLQVSDFTQPGVLSISNAAAATNQGLEIENEWLPNDAWALELNYAYLDATYDDYIAPLVISNVTTYIDVSGHPLNASPRHKLSPAARYTLDSNLGIWSFRAEYAWQDKQYFTAFQQDVSSQGAYGLINAQVQLTAPDTSWEVQAFGNNLADKDYSTSSREFPPTGVTRDINPPRTFGTRLTYHFL